MKYHRLSFFLIGILSMLSVMTLAQEKHHYQNDFSIEEFAARRTKVYDAIGNNAIAVIQGAKGLAGFSVFRQSKIGRAHV